MITDEDRQRVLDVLRMFGFVSLIAKSQDRNELRHPTKIADCGALLDALIVAARPKENP